MYPNSIQILDYFHAKEHLCDFAKESIRDENHRKAWVKLLSTALLEQQPEVVIQAIRELAPLAKNMETKREQLLNYYGENINRMRYSEFKKKGLFIGSGAIELAHKSVLQERMKRSGQHWSLDGLQQIAQLRVVYKSKRWHKIENFAKNAA